MLLFYTLLIEEDDDKAKFEKIYTLYRKKMWYTANSVLSDSYLAEDAVHNAFIGIAKNMKRIEEIDKNFKAELPVFEGMKTYDIHNAPFSLYGLKFGEKGFYRMDTEVADRVSDGVSALNFNTSGGVLRFRTDSVKITLTAELPDLCLMNHMALSGSSSFGIYCDGDFCGVFRAPSIEEYKGKWSSTLYLPEGMKDVMIFFPLYLLQKSNLQNSLFLLTNRNMYFRLVM